MASLARNPLATKPHANLIPGFSLQNTLRKLATSVKRSRSPDPVESIKRPRPTPEAVRIAAAARDESRRRDAREREHREAKEERERKRADKEEEFRIKYTRAFPSWTFYFDFDDPSAELSALKDKVVKRLLQLNARVDDFFSKEVTHLITLESDELPGNKENSRSKGGASLASPIKLKTRDTRASELVKKAQDFEIKVWSVEKLQSVLDRCIPPTRASTIASTSTATPSHHTHGSTKERPLTRLLESERLHGTSERDPTQRRHDFIYFSKNSYYVLVEDLRQELTTIAALEYPISRGRDGQERGSWPVLHCHPLARGPFFEYNEREERRREKLEQADKEHNDEMAERKAQVREMERRRRARLQMQAQRHGDLRRAVSMQNLRREDSNSPIDSPVDGEFDQFDREANESAAASGYLASGAYVAASGNSVSIASTTGTTSTAGFTSRNMQLPPSLREKIENQVLTSRKLTTSQRGKENAMGPPLSIPTRPQRILRKSKSTTTVRLTKRDEGAKPGYCECCRVKFDDFKTHIYSKRHRKFAEDDANFANLDEVLSRVRRRTVEEARAERSAWDDEEDDSDLDAPSEPDDGLDDEDDDEDDDVSMTGQTEVHWNEWVEDDF